MTKKFRIIALTLVLLALSLAACSPADVQDLKQAASASTTLAASASGTQPTAKPTQKPTSSTTGNNAPVPSSDKRLLDTAGDFDFYVMSLSWSPDYCAGSNVDDPQQCSIGKKLGFVLHGLWPQYTRGYPADCSSVKLPADAQQKFPSLYPNSSLYTHEWSKHGTCSGLTPIEYLTLAQTLRESIVIPVDYLKPDKAFRTTVDDLKSAFIQANPTLSEEAIAVQCSGSGRYLQEVRVCFSREGQPIACSQEVLKNGAKSCEQTNFLVRNVR